MISMYRIYGSRRFGRKGGYFCIGGLFMLIFLYNQKEIDWFNGRVYDEENNLIPDFYDERGCPTVPVAISSLTGRLGNIISTYVNFIALEYKLGYKYHRHGQDRRHVCSLCGIATVVCICWCIHSRDTPILQIHFFSF